MTTDWAKEIAAQNLRNLSENPYPGRGIVLGRSSDGSRLLQVYWIMGRSENSRNRVFVAEEGRLFTRPLHPERMEHPELVIYTAMDSHHGHHVVTNGDHTDTVINALRAGKGCEEALEQRRQEPDDPNFTPRIAGGVKEGDTSAWLAVLKADPSDTGRTLRHMFRFETLPAGLGWCVTTYQGDGNPLPSFQGEPYLLPLAGDSGEVLQTLWNALDTENRIALAVKEIEPSLDAASIRIVNAHTPAPGRDP